LPVMIKRFIILCILTSSVCHIANSQSFYTVRRDRSLILVAGINTSTYYGDLKDNSDIFDVRPSLTLGGLYYLSKRIGVRGEFSWVTLSGSDANSKDEGKILRNLSFTSGNYELSVVGLVNLIPQGGRFYQRPVFNVYAFGGIGGLYFNPKAELDGKKYALKPLQTEGVDYSRFAVIIPYGLGAKYKVSPFYNVVMEIGWRKAFTDYIDDVSTVFVDNESFTDPIAKQLADRRPEIGLPLKKAGSKRGEPTNDDAYMLFSLKVEYYLPYQLGNSQRKLYNRKRKAIYHR
jgi:hypothetical protein